MKNIKYFLTTVLLLLFFIQSAAQNENELNSKITIGKTITIKSQFNNSPVVEPHISSHPSNNNHLLIAAMVITDITNPYQSARLSSFISTDGGNTWKETAHNWWGYDPWTAILSNGETVMSWLGTEESFQHKFPVQFFSSSNGGITWNNMTQTSGGNYDGTKIAFYKNDFYFTTVRFRNDMGADVILYHKKSDGLFREVAKIDSRGKRLNFCEPAIISDGTVIIPASDFLQRIWVHSYNPGTKELSERRMVSLNPGGAKGYMRITTDNNENSPFKDRIYFIRALGSGTGYKGVWLNYSIDKGITWTVDLRVDKFDNNLSSKALVPSIAVNKKGITAISWVDSQHDPEQELTDVYFTFSEDGGKSFNHPVRVTSVSTNPKTPDNAEVANKFPGGGHYLGITARQDGSFQLIWSDSRSGIFELQTCNITIN